MDDLSTPTNPYLAADPGALLIPKERIVICKRRAAPIRAPANSYTGVLSVNKTQKWMDRSVNASPNVVGRPRRNERMPRSRSEQEMNRGMIRTKHLSKTNEKGRRLNCS